jgi:hypothetical protein
MGVITIPKVLRDKLGEEGTDAFAGVIKEIDLDARKDAIALAEERFERRLTEETGKINQRISDETGKINQRISDESGKLDQKITEECGKLRVEIEKSKSDIIKWVFVFWIGQIGVLSGIIFLMLKLFFDKV